VKRPVSLVLVIPLLVLALSASGCKSTSTATPAATPSASVTASASTSACPTSNTTAFAKSKFVLHVGLAAGTFHRYIYAPYQAKAFSKGTSGRLKASLKGGATALFDVHEINKAIVDVKASPVLCKALVALLTRVAAAFQALKSKLTGGDTSGVPALQTALSSVSSTSAQDGAAITESTDESQG
jgi:hypothetical protein